MRVYSDSGPGGSKGNLKLRELTNYIAYSHEFGFPALDVVFTKSMVSLCVTR